MDNKEDERKLNMERFLFINFCSQQEFECWCGQEKMNLETFGMCINTCIKLECNTLLVEDFFKPYPNLLRSFSDRWLREIKHIPIPKYILNMLPEQDRIFWNYMTK